jgi:hypothetical protein
MAITYREIPSTDPRLKRHVKHDSRSLAYPFVPKDVQVQTVRWDRHSPVLDQGNLGSCTGNAGIGCMATNPFYATLPAGVDLTETGAVKLYSEATALDDYQGDYPPDDTGSDGLSIGKALKARGWISGYTHVLSGANGIALALQTSPVIIGINWYESFYEPSASGQITLSTGSQLAGGHEVEVIGYDVEKGLFEFENSWGTEWGVGGNAFIADGLMDQLMTADGDCTVFTPVTAPAPVPIEDPALARFVGKVTPWLNRRVPQFGASTAQIETRRYLKAIKAI